MPYSKKNERLIYLLTVCFSRRVPLPVCQEASFNFSQITEGSSDSHKKKKCMKCITLLLLIKRRLINQSHQSHGEKRKKLKCRLLVPRSHHKIKISQVKFLIPYSLASSMVLIHIKIGDPLILGHFIIPQYALSTYFLDL